MSEPDHDDPLHDAIALVECASGDPLGFGAVVRNADHPQVTVILAKLLAELVNDNAAGYAVCAECFRSWASAAIERA
jgi:hypothetical protein